MRDLRPDEPRSTLSRRSFLKSGAASAVLVGSGVSIANGTPRDESADVAGQAKNVIFLVSDGMSTGTLTMADHMRRRMEGRPSTWIRLYERRRVRRAQMDMSSRNSIVTDSAAAGSSWGCGRRVDNGAVNMGPGGEVYLPILPIFRDAGRATGLVTTTRLTHATPASFATNAPSRNQEDEIAPQFLEREVDLLLGGGIRHFHAESRRDGRDLLGDFSRAGYHVIHQRDELLALPDNDGRLIGTFFDTHLPYTLDHRNTPEYASSIPTLAEMTDVALRRLSRREGGFILQVEGGRVDHAAHENDVGGLLYDQIAFDDAVEVAFRFADDNADTLVLLTTDHGNANPGLNAAGPGYNDSNPNFDKVQDFSHTNSWILSGLTNESTIEQIRERVEEATRLQIRQDEAEVVQATLNGTYAPAYRAMGGVRAALGQVLANHTSVNFIGTSHTADYVELAAAGPGSESVEGFVRNTDLFSLMCRAAGVMEAASAG